MFEPTLPRNISDLKDFDHPKRKAMPKILLQSQDEKLGHLDRLLQLGSEGFLDRINFEIFKTHERFKMMDRPFKGFFVGFF